MVQLCSGISINNVLNLIDSLIIYLIFLDFNKIIKVKLSRPTIYTEIGQIVACVFPRELKNLHDKFPLLQNRCKGLAVKVSDRQTDVKNKLKTKLFILLQVASKEIVSLSN